MKTKPNGAAEKQAKKEILAMRWAPEVLKELREMKKLSGLSMAEIADRAVKRYIAAEKPRLLARLRAELLPNSHRN